MLWTDAIFVTVDDLVSLDSEAKTIAGDENITLEGPEGFIRRMIDESGEEILRRIMTFGGWIGSSTLSANHIQAVLNIGGGAAAARIKILLDQVVVSDRISDKWSHLKRWVVYRILTSFYRNAYSRSATKDRYKSKLTEFDRELKRTQTYALTDLGLPIVYQPLARPAAFASATPTGSWGAENVIVTDGSGTVTGAYDAVVTYCDSKLYRNATSNGNAESHPSDRVTAQLSPAQVLKIDITTLIPPRGIQDPGTMALAVMTPLQASHWNVYVGKKGGILWLQNPAPIPIDTKTFTLDGDPIIGGSACGIGQYADRRYQFQTLLQRA